MGDFDTLTALAALLQFAILSGVVLRVMLTRHPPGSTFAWILITAILPYVGFLLYLMFGERPVGQLRARRYRKMFTRWGHRSQHKLTPTGPLPAHLARHRTLIHLATRMACLPVTFGSQLQLLSTTEDIFNSILSDIERAQKTIDMEFYIWSTGGETEKVADALLAAHRRGVRIRLLVDDFGAREFLTSKTCAYFKEAGISVASAMPMKFLRFFGLQRADLRLHRKTIIIDDQIGYTGSLNMIDPNSYDAAKTVGSWVDALVRLEGPAVMPLKITFINDWALQPDGDMSDIDPDSPSGPIPQKGHGAVVAVPSGPYTQREANLYLLLQAINDAQHSITITTPYFVPNEVLSAALLNAAYRGVAVKLIVPEKADSAMVSWAGRRHYHDLLEAGVKILTYHGGLLHTKSIAIDGEYAVFGTVNFDNRSLHLNFEMMLLIFDTNFLQALKHLHQQYETQCNMVDAENWHKRPISAKLKEGAAYLLAPLL